MSLSDADVQKQINHMMAFIEQEANEKVEEIDAKAEEEFNIEKGRLMQEQRKKIENYFVEKEKNVELQKRIRDSEMTSTSRLQLLKAREDHIKGVLEEAKQELSTATQDEKRYHDVLQKLILQAILQLLEKEVIIKCREKDKEFIESCLNDISTNFAKSVPEPCKLSVDQENFLPSECAGGVEVYAKGGKLKINNTLESRLDMISQQLLPEIRETLFGANPNRRFKD